MSVSKAIQKSRFILILSSLIHEPFLSLHSLLPTILLKTLGGSDWQLVLLTTLRGVAPIFSFYWHEITTSRGWSHRWCFTLSGLLAKIPFIWALFYNNTWLFIISSTFYVVFSKASFPPWMEALKINLPKATREKTFAIGKALGYAEGLFLAIYFGSLLKTEPDLWRSLFLASLFLGLFGIFLQASLPMKQKSPVSSPIGMKKLLKDPWKKSFSLLKERPDFLRFQMLFMMGGSALMLIQPALPFFLTKTLNLSYLDLMITFSLCKGFGYVFSSPLWSRMLSSLSVERFASSVLGCFLLFFLSLFLSSINVFWIFVAFALYGLSQAGSQLLWSLSGPIFSQNKESSRFSGINVLTIGLRGLIAPPLGGLVYHLAGDLAVFGIGASLYLIAFLYINNPIKKQALTPPSPSL